MNATLDAGLLIAIGLVVLTPIAIVALLRLAFEPRTNTQQVIAYPRVYVPGDIVNDHILTWDGQGYRWIPMTEAVR